MKNNNTMINYQNGKIYKVVNDVNDIVYIGSSTNTYLSNRMAMHRNSAKNKLTKFWTAMREVGVKHFQIILIKLFPCNSRLELESEEYAVMKDYQRQGIELYNTIIIREEFHSNFTRGSIQKNSDGKRWEFQWQEKGQKFSKSFSIKKWGGEWGAKRMAIVWQDMTYPIMK